MTASGTWCSPHRTGAAPASNWSYSGVTGDYVLTGTLRAAALTDPQRGTVTGEALIFNSRDDSVSIEGGGHETITETTAPK